MHITLTRPCNVYKSSIYFSSWPIFNWFAVCISFLYSFKKCQGMKWLQSGWGRIMGRNGRKMTVGVNDACRYHNNTSYLIGISLVLYLFDTPLCARNVIIHIKIHVALHESGSWIWGDANEDAVWIYWQTQAVWRHNWWPSLKITLFLFFSSQWEFNGWTSEEVSLHIERHKASLYWFA